MSAIGVKLQGIVPIDVNVVLAQYAEARGCGSVWVDEVRSRDALTAMAVLASATERITVGSSVVPIYSRTPAVLAMTAASLGELAPGRVVVGLGTSSQQIVERFHGVERRAPLAAMTEYVSVLRSALGGQRVEFSGEVVRVENFRLEMPSGHFSPPQIFVAALGPAMTRLAGRIGDGVLLNVVPESYLPRVRELVAEGRAEGALAGTEARIVSDLRVGVAHDEATAHSIRERQRKYLAYYGNVHPYNRHFERIGFPREAADLAAAWAEGSPERAVAAVSDELLDAVVVVGPPENVATRIRSFLSAGVDEAILFPCVAEDASTPAATQELIEVAVSALSDGEGGHP